eukprot:5603825-Amphidinium_carterae.1
MSWSQERENTYNTFGHVFNIVFVAADASEDGYKRISSSTAAWTTVVCHAHVKQCCEHMQHGVWRFHQLWKRKREREREQVPYQPSRGRRRLAELLKVRLVNCTWQVARASAPIVAGFYLGYCGTYHCNSCIRITWGVFRSTVPEGRCRASFFLTDLVKC